MTRVFLSFIAALLLTYVGCNSSEPTPPAGPPPTKEELKAEQEKQDEMAKKMMEMGGGPGTEDIRMPGEPPPGMSKEEFERLKEEEAKQAPE